MTHRVIRGKGEEREREREDLCTRVLVGTCCNA